MTKRLFFFLFVLLISAQSIAQLVTNSGKEFWFAYPEMYDQSRAVYCVNITGNDSTSGTVSIPGQSWTQNFSIKAGEVARVNLPSNSSFNRCMKKLEISSWVTFPTMLYSKACENGPCPMSCKRIAISVAFRSFFVIF